MIIEAEIEECAANAVRAALESAGIESDRILTSTGWEVPEEGRVKGFEDGDVIACVEVVAGQRQFPSYGVCYCEIPLSILVSVRSETDSRGELVRNVYGVVQELVTRMHLDEDNDLDSMLSTPSGSFKAQGLSVQGGDAMDYDSEIHAFNFTISLTVTGLLSH